ncbi:MAG: phosphonate utilization associated transcriptional regulator [Burkholderiaceae bacterium]
MPDRSHHNGMSAARAAEPPRAVPPSIAVLRSASLSSAAQHEIERMILEGEITAGTKLTEAWLSERLGVSRGPIREAFRMLEEAGLVRQEKNRGVFVREIPLEEALEIFDLRAAMDEVVGRRLAETMTAEQMKAARAIVEQMDIAARGGDSDAYHRLNLHFHDALVEFAGNRKLAGVYRKLVKELALYRRRSVSDQSMLPSSAAEHRAILKAIASGDGEVAGRAMYEHVTESKHRVVHGVVAAHLPRAKPVRAPSARKARG